MSVSTSVIGLKLPDERWLQMKTIYDACQKLMIDPPVEVERFFGWNPPTANQSSVEVDLTPLANYYQTNSDEWWDVFLSDLPPEITIIRFMRSY